MPLNAQLALQLVEAIERMGENCTLMDAKQLIKNVRDKAERYDDHPLYREDNRFVLDTSDFPEIYELYLNLRKTSWGPNELHIEKSRMDWLELDVLEEHMVIMMLSFFASADVLIGVNLLETFASYFKNPCVQLFLAQQAQNEGIHQIVYNDFIRILTATPEQQQAIFQSVKTMPGVKEKMQWAENYLLNPEVSMGEKIVAAIGIEGIFFASPFCIIFWLGSLNKMQQLQQANEMIRKDETVHTRFNIALWKAMPDRCSYDRAKEIIRSATEIECFFAENAVPDALERSDMNKELMKKHVMATANIWTEEMGLGPLFRDENEGTLKTPFSFMIANEYDTKADFLQIENANYLTRPELGQCENDYGFDDI